MSHRDGDPQHESQGNGHEMTRARRRPTDVVHEMVRQDRAEHPERTTAGTTASADAVETVRLALRDLKHDVRMLKVGMDKQQQMLEYLATAIERLPTDDRNA